MEFDRVQDLYNICRAEVGKVIVGQDDLVDGVLIGLFSEGNLLIEGVPGLGKTLLVTVLSQVLTCSFKRIQFTPDLMPSDLTGHSVYDMNERRFTFSPGPIFANLVLADEINRAPPKTQSALLEAMQEGQVTVDGEGHRLQRPFLVIATQNPIEHEGTYPLPEAQVDRFMFKLLVDYPSLESEVEILSHYAAGGNHRNLLGSDLKPVMHAAEVLEIQEAVSRVIVVPEILSYIVSIVARTRGWHSVLVGSSPRGSVNLLLASRTVAACRGRNFVIPDDVKEVTPWVLRHRLRLKPEVEIEGITADQVIDEILSGVPVPKS